MGEGMGKRAELTQAHTSRGSDNGDGAALSAPSRLPLFILSSHDRDMLSGYAMQAGWRPVAARGASEAGERVRGSRAQVAVVDARRRFDRSLPHISALSEAVEAVGGALLVLVDPVDSARLPDVLAAGATHYLAEDITAARFATALAFASRHVERLGGGRADLSNHNAIQRSDALFWRYDPADGRVTLSSALAKIGRATSELQSLMRISYA